MTTSPKKKTSKKKAKKNRLYEILSNYTPVPEAGCWLWDGRINAGGYGQASILGKEMLVHRLAYLAKTGEMPWGKTVRHTCDVRLCINPDHLLAGSQEENVKDMIAKGRGAWQKNG